jgi:hypothetical protein
MLIAMSSISISALASAFITTIVVALIVVLAGEKRKDEPWLKIASAVLVFIGTLLGVWTTSRKSEETRSFLESQFSDVLAHIAHLKSVPNEHLRSELASILADSLRRTSRYSPSLARSIEDHVRNAGQPPHGSVGTGIEQPYSMTPSLKNGALPLTSHESEQLARAESSPIIDPPADAPPIASTTSQPYWLGLARRGMSGRVHLHLMGKWNQTDRYELSDGRTITQATPPLALQFENDGTVVISRQTGSGVLSVTRMMCNVAVADTSPSNEICVITAALVGSTGGQDVIFSGVRVDLGQNLSGAQYATQMTVNPIVSSQPGRPVFVRQNGNND